MDFLLELVVLTIGLGVAGYFFLNLGDKNPLLGILGAFTLIGAFGGMLFVGFFVAALVYSRVSQASFGLLGIAIASPFVLVPLYVIWKWFNRKGRGYDGRGFEDGDGSN